MAGKWEPDRCGEQGALLGASLPGLVDHSKTWPHPEWDGASRGPEGGDRLDSANVLMGGPLGSPGGVDEGCGKERVWRSGPAMFGGGKAEGAAGLVNLGCLSGAQERH